MFHSDTTRKLSSRIAPTGNCRLSRILFLWIALLFAFGIASTGTSWAAGIPSLQGTSVGPGQQFAIADFDGDLRPDLASVRSGLNTTGSTNYWIDLQFSVAKRQSIQVVGPLGGLLIAARDVNGDHAVDLILSTPGNSESLAVFLNDGHGHFSKADPTLFPEAFRNSGTSFEPSPNNVNDNAGVAPQSRAGFFLKTRPRAHPGKSAGSILVVDAGFLLNSFVISHAGRAPPSEIFL